MLENVVPRRDHSGAEFKSFALRNRGNLHSQERNGVDTPQTSGVRFLSIAVRRSEPYYGFVIIQSNMVERMPKPPVSPIVFVIDDHPLIRRSPDLRGREGLNHA
jgi:hypothetical protein